MSFNRNSSPKIAILCWEAGYVPKGLIQLESLIGNSTNLDTYPFPVRVCRISGANIETVLEHPSRVVLQEMIAQSRRLVDNGICAITTSCGFNAIFQRELAKALPVPVFTSSLLQVPMVSSVLPKDRSIAIVTAKKLALTRKHFDAVGITESMNVNVFGMESSMEWNKLFTNPGQGFDLDVISADIVHIALEAISQNPKTGAFVLECTDLPPFADAIKKATNLPVFDFQTLMSMIARSIGVLHWY